MNLYKYLLNKITAKIEWQCEYLIRNLLAANAINKQSSAIIRTLLAMRLSHSAQNTHSKISYFSFLIKPARM